jgi:pimeloyl-ACP methyl ester carboxylesterase
MELVRPDGAVLWWASRGEGPPVVITHGLFGDHHVFDAVARVLVGAGFRVVTWDLRVHGRSSRGLRGLVFEDLVRDLLAICDAAEVVDAVLIGHDIGGVLSLEACLERPEAFAGVSVWCTDPTPAPRDRVAAAAVLAARHVAMRPLVIAMEPFMTRVGGPLALLQRRTATTLPPAGVAEVIEAASRRDDLMPRLGDLWGPVQVVWGEQDLLVRPFASRDLLSVLPAAERLSVPESGHLVHVDRPEVVLPAVLAFVQRATA